MNETATQGTVAFVGIAPHPPIMVPEVGRDEISKVRASIEGMAVLAERVIRSGARSLVMISPHAPLEADAFVAYSDDVLAGDFANFLASDAKVSAGLDRSLLESIERAAAERALRVGRLEECKLDHGTAVPLYFLLRHGWRGCVVALGYCFRPNEDHITFGRAIADAIKRVGYPVAMIASGDLSHRLKPSAPAGYFEDAHLFDDEVVGCLSAGHPERIAAISLDVRRRAGECGYRSMLVGLGVAESARRAPEVISYEAPFGVGYLVAQLARAAEAGLQAERTIAGAEDDVSRLPSLARRAVESFVSRGEIIKPDHNPPLPRAACFVTLRESSGELRGCIGTIEAAQSSLDEEVIHNAISAATNDPRFPPVTVQELPHLCYSVDVLGAIERATAESLDPAQYGVIVEDKGGVRRGLLLPNIAGIETVAQQVMIAARKGGITEHSDLRLSRFRVQRISEPQNTAKAI